MWIRFLGAIVLGLMLYVASSLLLLNVITGTSAVISFVQQAVPLTIAAVVVALVGMGIFHST